MEIVIFLVPWILIGIGIIFVSFSGGPGEARRAYLTRGNRAFTIAIPLIYIAFGVAVPALALNSRGESTGATGALAHQDLPENLERGKQLFRETCASCHDLDAINANGVTGPDLDQIGEITPERIITAIREGGTGQKRMPAGLLEGENAEAVANYVAAVAGK